MRLPKYQHIVFSINLNFSIFSSYLIWFDGHSMPKEASMNRVYQSCFIQSHFSKPLDHLLSNPLVRRNGY